MNLRKYATGGPTNPPTKPYEAKSKADYDHRVQMYNDSLTLYNYTQLQKQLEPSGTKGVVGGTKEEMQLRIAADRAVKSSPMIDWKSHLWGLYRRYAGPEQVDDERMGRPTHQSPDIEHKTIQPTSEWTGAGKNFAYDTKPKQKVLPPLSLSEKSEQLKDDEQDVQASVVATVHTRPEPKPRPVERVRLDRMKPRLPQEDGARTPASVSVQDVPFPSYRFRGGFVDPRVAAAARQDAADPELLTQDQLKYRDKAEGVKAYFRGGPTNSIPDTMRFRTTPKTFGNPVKTAQSASSSQAGSMIAPIAGAMTQALPEGVSGTNDFRFTKMGAPLMAVSPLVGGAAMAVGLGADLITGSAQKKKAQKTVLDNGLLAQEQADANSVYNQEGGYNQEMFQFRRGGRSVVPNSSMDKASVQFGKVGAPIQRVGGSGGPMQDDQQMQTPTGSVAVSSGEGITSDDVLNKVARSMGIGFAEYQRSLWPDAEGGNMRQYARGGPGSPLTRAPRAPSIPMEDYGTMIDVSMSTALGGEYQDLLGRRASRTSLLDPTPMVPKSVMPPGPSAAIPPTANPFDGVEAAKSAATALEDKANDQTKSNQTTDSEELQLARLNRMARNVNMGASTASTVYNLLSRRTPGVAPRKVESTPLDLDTGALRNRLNNETNRSIKSAQYSFRGRQSLGAELGIIAAGANQKVENAEKVTAVENKVKEYNNQLRNSDDRINTGAFNEFTKNEVAASNSFRLAKGQAVSQGIAAMADSYGSYINGQISLSQMGKQASLYDSFRSFRSGESNDAAFDEQYVYDPFGYRKKRASSSSNSVKQ